MKKNTALLLPIMAVIYLIGCDSPANETHDSDLKSFREDPITITWNGNSTDGVQSFQANVQVFSKNSRKNTAAGLSREYRMAVRTVDDAVLTRIDFEDNSMPFRSVISNGEEAVLFNPITEEIGYRIPLEDSKSPLYRIFAGQSGLSRINLSLIRQEAQRLSLDITEDTDNNTLLLELPPALIPQNGLDKIVKSRAVFNLANDTLLETEVVMIREDDTNVTTTVTPVYEDKDGVPVKVGMVTVINSKAPALIEGIDPDTVYYNSPDEIPTLTAEEFAEMQKAGNIHEVPNMTYGNPADLSYVQTIYEVYRDIEINSAPESLFRLIQK
ncbi:MAG: hypothetical protein LBU85_00805 [Treponema sp.]|jgi:hypothetical protein|nr:hypothetical protein [Treponema sp.]